MKSGFPASQDGVVLVEDNASVRRAMARLLAMEGYLVMAAASLAEALLAI